MTAPPKYPDVVVALDLNGPGGNAYAIIARVRLALRRAGASQSDLDAFSAEATAGRYDDLLAAVRRWVIAA